MGADQDPLSVLFRSSSVPSSDPQAASAVLYLCASLSSVLMRLGVEEEGEVLECMLAVLLLSSDASLSPHPQQSLDPPLACPSA